MRRHKTANVQSEPRVTRYMVRSNRYASTSTPASPSEVQLDRRQDLRNVLQRGRPAGPEHVDMVDATVQRFDWALRNMNVNEQNAASGRLRRRNRVDYRQLHRYGRGDP